MAKNSTKLKTFAIGRDSETGQFIPLKEAKRRPTKATIVRVPKVGHGDTAPKSKRELKKIRDQYGPSLQRLAKK